MFGLRAVTIAMGQQSIGSHRPTEILRENMIDEIQYLSYSSINLYLTCAESWRRKYILGEPSPSTVPLIFGSAIHGTVEKAISQAHASDGLNAHLTALWPNVWAAKMEEEGARVEWGADTPEQHYNEGIRLLGAPEVQKMIDGITPFVDEAGVFIERKVSLTVPGVPVPIIGYIDMMTADGVPGDFKTSKSRWSQDDAESEIQPLFYLAALHQAGHKVPGNKFRHYVVTKAKKPEAQILEHSHTWQEIFWLYDLIRRVWQGIAAEVFPVNPGAWLCGPKYCAYWNECRGKR